MSTAFLFGDAIEEHFGDNVGPIQCGDVIVLLVCVSSGMTVGSTCEHKPAVDAQRVSTLFPSPSWVSICSHKPGKAYSD